MFLRLVYSLLILNVFLRRHTSKTSRFGEDLLETVKVITSGCLVAPRSLGKLEKTWVEYYAAQEEIRSCRSVVCGYLMKAFFMLRQT